MSTSKVAPDLQLSHRKVMNKTWGSRHFGFTQLIQNVGTSVK